MLLLLFWCVLVVAAIIGRHKFTAILKGGRKGLPYDSVVLIFKIFVCLPLWRILFRQENKNGLLLCISPRGYDNC